MTQHPTHAPMSKGAQEPPHSAGIESYRLMELDAAMGRIYPRMLDGYDFSALLTELCAAIANNLDVPLAILWRAMPGGGLNCVAQSSQNDLWADLQQVPPRWDTGYSGNGSAGQALRMQRAHMMEASNEGLILWRHALERHQVAHVVALPLMLDHGNYVFELYSRHHCEHFSASDLWRIAEDVKKILQHHHELEQRSRLARALEHAGVPAFLTDLNGTIVWCNEAIARLSGYERSEIVGRNPRFLKSGKQGVRYYRDLWATIRNGKVWQGETVDRDRNGRLYTVDQSVSPIPDGERIGHYLCVQTDVSRRTQHIKLLERDCRIDSSTGLLTLAAFESEAQAAIDAGANSGPSMLTVITMPELGARLSGLDADIEFLVTAEIAERIRTMGGNPLACATAPAEFLLFHTACDWNADQLLAALAKPLKTMNDQTFSARAVNATFPRESETVQGLRHAAERKLADAPMPRRQAAALH